jgi:hypothetical protein
MMRILRLKDALLATIHTAEFKTLEKNDTTAAAIKDISNPNFFKALYVLLRAVFPALRVLRFCDKGEPCLDKIFYLAHRATEALAKSKAILEDDAIFQFEDDENLEVVQDDVYGSGRRTNQNSDR